MILLLLLLLMMMMKLMLVIAECENILSILCHLQLDMLHIVAYLQLCREIKQTT